MFCSNPQCQKQESDTNLTHCTECHWNLLITPTTYVWADASSYVSADASCSRCGHKFAENDAGFCSKCGHKTTKSVEVEESGKKMLLAGIEDVFVGGFLFFYSLWLSNQTFAWNAPDVIRDGTYTWWLYIIGVASMAEGVYAIVYRNDSSKYGLIFIGQIGLMILSAIFVFVAGWEVASHVGGGAWLLVLVPISYIFGAVRVKKLL